MSPLRFIWRCTLAVLWFARCGLRAVREARAAVAPADLSHRYASRLSEGFTRIFRLRYEVRNRERILSTQPCIYLANHRSNLDLVTHCAFFPSRTIVIGKLEVLRVPLLGTIFEKGGNVALDRKDPERARAGMELSEKKIRDEGQSIFVFPEGTRNYGTMRPFKKGAFHLARNTGAPILPIVCAVTPGWLRGRRLWVAREVRVLVEVLEPVDPGGFDSVDALIEETRNRMVTALGRLEAEVRA